MVEISVLDAFGAAAVEACSTIGDHVLIANEADLKDQIDKNKRWPLLVCVMPRSEGDDRGHDNYAERNIALFYILHPMSEKLNKEGRVEVWAKTQTAMKDLKTFIRTQMEGGDFFEMLNDADFGKRDQEPEFNFMGCVGWSLLFSYTTGGM